MYAKYLVTFTYRKDRTKHSEVVLAKSPNEATDEVEKKHGYDINIIDVHEHLPSWEDSLIGKLFKWIFRKIFK